MSHNSVPSPNEHSPGVTSWTPYISLAGILYLLLCSYLRFQRRDAMQKKYNFPTKESFSKMTNVQAQEIAAYMNELEFPRLYEASLQFALFRVRG